MSGGALGAGRRVAALLADAVPDRLRVVETSSGLDAGWLPDPALVTSVMPGELGIEDYPALLVSVLSSTAGDLDDLDTYGDPTDGPGVSLAPAELWTITYRLRVEVFVVAENVAVADTLRYAYLLAVREALLAHRDVPDYDAAATQALLGGASPLFTEAFDTVATAENRAWSQALLDFPLTVAERLTGAPGVGVESITLAPTVLGLADPAPMSGHPPTLPPTWHPSD